MAGIKPIIRITTDTNKMTRLGTKLAKYPAFAIQAGLRAASDYLNEDTFRESMYPPESDAPFQWSSEKQRRAYFATDGFGSGIPYKRTHELMLSGAFTVQEGSLWVQYENTAPYSPYVIHPTSQIIGLKKRGWKPVNTFVVAKSRDIAKIFEKAVKDAWKDNENFVFGGGAGL